MNTLKHLPLNVAHLKKATFLLEVCLRPTCKRLLTLFVQHPQMTLPEMSRHLFYDDEKTRLHIGLLLKAGLIHRKHYLGHHYYEINESKMGIIKHSISDFLRHDLAEVFC